MSRVPLIVVLLSGLFLSVGHSTAQAREPYPHTPRPAGTPAPTTTVLAVLLKTLLADINRDRAEHHVAPLKLNSRQSSCSRKHSRHMATSGEISHDQFPSDICIPHVYTAENVGQASGNPASGLLTIHESMMAEGPCPKHRCTEAQAEAHGHYINLMNPGYTRLGIGIYIGSGSVWLTEDFTG